MSRGRNYIWELERAGRPADRHTGPKYRARVTVKLQAKLDRGEGQILNGVGQIRDAHVSDLQKKAFAYARRLPTLRSRNPGMPQAF
jgi:hypothetical protein